MATGSHTASLQAKKYLKITIKKCISIAYTVLYKVEKNKVYT